MTSLYKQLNMLFVSSGNSWLFMIETIIVYMHCYIFVFICLCRDRQTDGGRKRGLNWKLSAFCLRVASQFLQLRIRTVDGSACQQFVAIK